MPRWMSFSLWTSAILVCPYESDIVEGFSSASVLAPHRLTDSALFMGKSRKARRTQQVEKQGKSRPQQFFDAIEDATDAPPKDSPPQDKKGKDPPSSAADAEREARVEEAKQRMDERPDVSTMIVDEETGIEIVAQGKAVMDVITRKAVKLSDLGPDYRLAQMFPGVPPQVRDKYRFNWNTVEVPQMVEALRGACSVKLQAGSVGIPPHPSVANKAIDFVLANRDYLGFRMKKTLGRLQMRNMWQGNAKEAEEYQKLWKNFLTLENHISAPFRQMIMDGEGRVGPNFGNLDLMSYCSGDLYERCANYLVLKGMVAHWEQKVKDAEYVESTPQTKENFMTVLCHGDPKRYLPEPPILFRLNECAQVCLMAQKMCKAFVETPELFDDFPPEIRFMEKALTIKGGTALRKYMVEEFCPAEGITPEGLREGMRRLYQQLENMQIDPYGDLTSILDRLNGAMAIGTDDERDPYELYLSNPDPNGPGYFQTYTFNHEPLSLVRFLDGKYIDRENPAPPTPVALPNLFDFGGMQPPEDQPDRFDAIPVGEVYKVPELRAIGRPHDLGWLNLLKDEDNSDMRLGKISPGKIISDSE